MKTYTDHTKLNRIEFNGLWIPKDEANADYQKALKEVEAGEAEIVPYVEPVESDQSKISRLEKACMDYQTNPVELRMTGNFTSLVMGIKIAGNAGVKAQACINWLDGLWAQYYAGKADIDNANFDFSAHGNPPHSFADVRTEAGL